MAVAQNSRPCMGCGATIYRTGSTAPVKHYCGPECRPRCGIDGCDKPRHGDTYCSAHHTRWKRTGDPLTPFERLPNSGACSVAGCDQPMRKKTWCASHYTQWAECGEVRPFAWKWGDGRYIATHTRLRRLLGAASGFPCSDCGRQAQEWSYDHNDPDVKHDPEHSGCAYSRNPDCYSPRCALCHRSFDRSHRVTP